MAGRSLRAVFDEARAVGDIREAVVSIDMMAAAELVSLRQLREYVEGCGGVRGVPQVRRALDLASEDSRSPNETRLRLIWDLVVDRIHESRARARRLPADRRAWTVEPPPDRPLELPLHERLEQIAEWERWESARDDAM